jgi:hypothetical protein
LHGGGHTDCSELAVVATFLGLAWRKTKTISAAGRFKGTPFPARVSQSIDEALLLLQPESAATMLPYLPWSLSHGDFHPMNWLMQKEEEEEEEEDNAGMSAEEEPPLLVVLDFQLAGLMEPARCVCF